MDDKWKVNETFLKIFSLSISLILLLFFTLIQRTYNNVLKDFVAAVILHSNWDKMQNKVLCTWIKERPETQTIEPGWHRGRA